jgi:hypothetical protein
MPLGMLSFVGGMVIRRVITSHVCLSLFLLRFFLSICFGGLVDFDYHYFGSYCSPYLCAECFGGFAFGAQVRGVVLSE